MQTNTTDWSLYHSNPKIKDTVFTVNGQRSILEGEPHNPKSWQPVEYNNEVDWREYHSAGAVPGYKFDENGHYIPLEEEPVVDERVDIR